MAQVYSQTSTGAALQALCAIAARNSNDAAVRNMTGYGLPPSQLWPSIACMLPGRDLQQSGVWS